jgi:hypothetical protein
MQINLRRSHVVTKRTMSLIVVVALAALVLLSGCTPPGSAAQDYTANVAADKAALDVVFTSGDSPTNVTKNMTFPTSGAGGTTIAWSSDNAAVVSAAGVVSRPGSDATVTLTATLSRGTATATKVFTFTVKGTSPDVAADRAALVIVFTGGETAAGVKQNMTLSVLGSNGCTISWASDTPAVVSTSGGVTRPANNATVVLTATITKGLVSDTKPFSLTVLGTNWDSVVAAKAALAITFGGSDSAASVTQSMTLPLTGTGSTTVSWSSDHTGIVANNGTVTQPGSDTAVVLTATITKGATSDTKAFLVTVKAAPASHTVTFVYQTQTISCQNIDEGVTASLDPFIPPANYTFSGWATSADSLVVAYYDKGLFTMGSSNVTLYAICTVNEN